MNNDGKGEFLTCAIPWMVGNLINISSEPQVLSGRSIELQLHSMAATELELPRRNRAKITWLGPTFALRERMYVRGSRQTTGT